MYPFSNSIVVIKHITTKHVDMIVLGVGVGMQALQSYGLCGLGKVDYYQTSINL